MFHHMGAIMNLPAMGWKQRMVAQVKNSGPHGAKPTLYPCGHFGQAVKIGLTAVTVGSYGVPYGGRGKQADARPPLMDGGSRLHEGAPSPRPSDASIATRFRYKIATE